MAELSAEAGNNARGPDLAGLSWIKDKCARVEISRSQLYGFQKSFGSSVLWLMRDFVRVLWLQTEVNALILHDT
ncbi:MAG: hypothetical protein AAGF32_08720, partial [Pseudomonadota bacterium]